MAGDRSLPYHDLTSQADPFFYKGEGDGYYPSLYNVDMSGSPKTAYYANAGRNPAAAASPDMANFWADRARAWPTGAEPAARLESGAAAAEAYAAEAEAPAGAEQRGSGGFSITFG
jgi:hypothetical protein